MFGFANIIKTRKVHKILSILFVLVFATLVSTSVAAAWGNDGSDSDCCGGGGFGDIGGGGDSWIGGGDSWSWEPPTPPPPPAPTCSISASPNQIAEGGTVTLSWSTSNATVASISGIGAVSVGSGSTSVTVNSNTTYTMTVTGAGGTATCSTSVTVIPRPSCTITADKTEIDAGGNVTLSWTTENANSASISGIGNVGLSGSYTVHNLLQSTTYTMTVSGDGGESTCSVSINVNTIPSCSIHAEPSTVSYGGNTTLVWTSENATEAFIDKIGSVATMGSYTVTNLTSDTTYTLTVRNANGVERQCSTTVLVSSPSASCNISFSPSSVEYGGSSVLVWNASNARSVYITNIGSVGNSGSYTVNNITGNLTYTMTVVGWDNRTYTCSATVYVEDELSCNIYASPNPSRDGSTTLTWTSSGASWAIINNGIGSVSLNGSKTIVGLENGTKVYTLTVGRGSETRTCSVTVRVDKNVAAPSCSLTASRTTVPAGEGTTLYWTAQNATIAAFNDYGAVALSGSRVVYPSQSQEYVLVVTDTEGRQAECRVYINVESSSSITVSSIPYTGPEDVLYTLAMMLVFFGSVYGIYSRRHLLGF